MGIGRVNVTQCYRAPTTRELSKLTERVAEVLSDLTSFYEIFQKILFLFCNYKKFQPGLLQQKQDHQLFGFCTSAKWDKRETQKALRIECLKSKQIHNTPELARDLRGAGSSAQPCWRGYHVARFICMLKRRQSCNNTNSFFLFCSCKRQNLERICS